MVSCTVCRRAKEPRAKVIVSMAFATTLKIPAIRPSSVLQKVERHEVNNKAQRVTAMVGMTTKGRSDGKGWNSSGKGWEQQKASRNEQFGDSKQKEYDFLVMEMSTHEKIVRDSDWCVPVKHVAKLNRMRGQTPTVKITSNDPFSRCKSVQ